MRTAPVAGPAMAKQAARDHAAPMFDGLVDTLADPRTERDREIVRYVLAVCSGYAYSDEATVLDAVAKLGLVGAHCFRAYQFVDAMLIASDGYLIQSSDGRVVILCYRGTPPLSVITWALDLDCRTQPVRLALGGEPGRDYDVHEGIHRNLLATKDEIDAGLRRARAGSSVVPDGGDVGRPEVLYFTGHSLGGAMAALMAAMLDDTSWLREDGLLGGLCTFGQPMIGSPEFAASCDADPFLSGRTERFIYRQDLIPKLPARQWGRFAHFGPGWRYDDGGWAPAGNVAQLNEWEWLATGPVAALARQLPRLRSRQFHPTVADHFPNHYISATTPMGVDKLF